MTKNTLTHLALASALTLGCGTAAFAQDSGALLDALVRKKVLSSQEAEDVRADLIRENAASNAGKLQLSNSVTSLKLYGDVRLRYQYDNRDAQIEAAPTTSNLETYSDGKTYVPGDTTVVTPAGKVIKGSLKPGTTAVGAPQQGYQRSRERIRLRLGADVELTNGFFGGIQLQTVQNADSANQTMGDSATGAAGFGNYNLYVSRAFVGWKANDWFTIIGGKQANPFYTTDLIWDADINPEGFVEKVDLVKLFTGGIQEAIGYGADGKQVTSVSTIKSESPFGLSLVAGQFAVCDNNEDAVGSGYKTDAWLFNTQLIGTAKVTPNVKVTLAPGYMAYTAGNLSDLNNETPFMTFKSGATVLADYQYSANQKLLPQHPIAATRDLSIITAPGDISFKLCGLKTKLLWDFAYNTQGAARVEDVYGLQDIQVPVYNSKGVLTGYKHGNAPVNGDTLVSTTKVSGHSSRDDIAWLAGVQVGENKKKGDWSVMANFRQTGLGSVDPNLNDSDFAFGQLNMQGVKTGVAYNFTDFCVASVTYYDAWNLRKDIIGGQATSGQKIASLNSTQTVQVDLSVKF